MTPEVWRHVASTGEDYTMTEIEPGVFVYRYRPCECRTKAEREAAR